MYTIRITKTTQNKLMKPRIYWYYYKKLFWRNLILSGFIAAFITFPNPSDSIAFFNTFSFVFISGGYALTILALHFTEKRTKYMYYNMGFSFSRFYLFSFLFNLLLMGIVFYSVQKLWMK